MPPRSVASSATQPSPPSTAILIPANNEEKLIERIVGALAPQVRDIDTLLVVADNCDDETADIARAHGAIVIERREPQRRGKGYAIGYGIEYLRRVEPEVVAEIFECQHAGQIRDPAVGSEHGAGLQVRRACDGRVRRRFHHQCLVYQRCQSWRRL